VFFVLFLLCVLFLFVLSVLVYGLLPPSDNSIAVVVVVVVVVVVEVVVVVVVE